MKFDRLKETFLAAARAAFPRIDYLALYAGTVVAQGGDNSFDVQPDDARVPGLSGVPILLGLPGLKLQLDLSSKPRCLIGWKNGDPALPYITLWESGAAALKVTLDATEIDLGANAVDAVVKGTSLFNIALPAVDAALGPPGGISSITIVPPISTLPQCAAALNIIVPSLVALLGSFQAAFAAGNLSTKVKVE